MKKTFSAAGGDVVVTFMQMFLRVRVLVASENVARSSGRSSQRLETRRLKHFSNFGGRVRRLERFIKGSSLFRARFSPL
jgi:hypothetical protein